VHVDTGAGKAIATVNLPSANTRPLVVDPTHVWAAYSGDVDEGIAVLDAGGTKVATTIDVGGVAGFPMVVNDGAAWVPVLPHASGGGIVVAIDPSTNAVVDRLSIADGTP